MITSNFTVGDDLAFDVAGPAGHCTVAINDQGLYTLSLDPSYPAAPLGVALEEAARRPDRPHGPPHSQLHRHRSRDPAPRTPTRGGVVGIGGCVGGRL